MEDRFDCKDYNILAPDNKLAFLGFDITCEEVSIDDINMIGEGSVDNIQLDDDGKVRVIHIDQQQVIEEYFSSSLAKTASKNARLVRKTKIDTQYQKPGWISVFATA